VVFRRRSFDESFPLTRYSFEEIEAIYGREVISERVWQTKLAT